MSTLQYTASCPDCGHDCMWTNTLSAFTLDSKSGVVITVRCQRCDARDRASRARLAVAE